MRLEVPGLVAVWGLGLAPLLWEASRGFLGTRVSGSRSSSCWDGGLREARRKQITELSSILVASAIGEHAMLSSIVPIDV